VPRFLEIAGLQVIARGLHERLERGLGNCALNLVA
jgi:hypothetical protein